MTEDERYMFMALREAELALEEGETPVGAVIVHEGHVVAKAHNQRELLKDATAHAEILAITQASAALDRWRLTGCTLYVTIEPCPMCAGAIVQSRIDRVIYGAEDPKAGAAGSLMDILRDERLNHRAEVKGNVLAAECGGLLTTFFQVLRQKKKSVASNDI